MQKKGVLARSALDRGLLLAICLAFLALQLAASEAKALPPNWSLTPAFSELGFETLACPGPDAAESVEIQFSVREDILIGYSMSVSASSIDMNHAMAAEQKNGVWTLTLTFPTSGDYTLSIDAALKTDSKHYSAIAEARFFARLPSESLPMDWIPNSGFSGFGVSASPTVISAARGLAIVAFTSENPIEISFDLKDAATGRYMNELPSDAVAVDSDGRDTSVYISAPKRGNYELRIFGKLPFASTRNLIGTVRLALPDPPPPPELPENWRIGPEYWIAGCRPLEAMPRDIGGETVVRFTVPPDFVPEILLLDGSRSPIATASVRLSGSELRVDALFPKDGHYTLEIGGAARDGAVSRAIAWGEFQAKVGEGLSPYVLRDSGGVLSRLPVEAVTASGAGRFSGTLARAFEVSAAGLNFGASKGARVEFYSDDGAAVRLLSLALDRDVAIPIADRAVSLRKGTLVTVGRQGNSGRISAAATFDRAETLLLRGRELICPSGSRLVVEPSEDGIGFELRVAAATIVPTGIRSYTALAGSIIRISKDAVASISYPEAATQAASGVPGGIMPHWAIELSTDGAIVSRRQEP